MSRPEECVRGYSDVHKDVKCEEHREVLYGGVKSLFVRHDAIWVEGLLDLYVIISLALI